MHIDHRSAYSAPSPVADHDHLARPDPPYHGGVPPLVPGKQKPRAYLRQRSSEFIQEEWICHGQQFGSAASLASERVPQPPEDTAAVLLHGDLWPGLLPELG